MGGQWFPVGGRNEGLGVNLRKRFPVKRGRAVGGVPCNIRCLLQWVVNLGGGVPCKCRSQF